jgi:Transposase IS4
MSDKLYKVRPMLFKLLLASRRHFNLSQDLANDEGHDPGKNRFSIKQYIKDKPTKWGIKSFILCKSVSGYVYNIEVYTGTMREPIPDIGKTGNVVALLATGVENMNHTLYMDRYYCCDPG